MNFLLEIGTEEIPHWMIPGALAQLAQLDLFGATPQVDATARRLVVRATGLPDRTPDQEQLVKGPPITAGDKAAAGFAKKQGVELSAMQKVGDYYELRKTIKGRAVRDILAESLPGSILGIQWPKTMYWGAKGGPRFIRPIRWIVALLDGEVIDFEIAGVKSGNLSYGHRVLANKQVPVTYDSIESTLKSNMVILSAEERRNKIVKEATALGATIDPDLLETLTYITEFPAAIKGDFDPSYLELPAEVLTMVMRHHQKYFAVETKPGVLAPHFVAVMNVPVDPNGLVKRGNERVLKARFNDARFFWEVDQKKPLTERVDDLARVTFHAKIGSYLEKTKRIELLAGELGQRVQPVYPNINLAALQTAAGLCKCDLTTELVKEFTELQGVIGGHYILRQLSGSPNIAAIEVAKAISSHYRPLGADDDIPPTIEGTILAIADKIDTLREFFRVGMAPTGSKDPFALRRAAQGVVRILVETDPGLPLPLDDLSAGNADLLDFLNDRVRNYFGEKHDFAYDTVDAVMGGTGNDLHDRASLLASIKKRLGTEALKRTVLNNKRIRKILVEDEAMEGAAAFSEALLEDGPEKALHRRYLEILGAAFEASIAKRNYDAALDAAASIYPELDAFFESVMVMVDDRRLRLNRLGLLQLISISFLMIADFSKIVIPGDQK